MNPALQFDFLADKDHKRITIRREFMAGRQLVWDCHTKSELLNRWFAPKPFTTKTKAMDFRVGGHWHYAMVDPGGKEYWGRMDYQTIDPIDHYTGLDGFCDEAGELNPDLPRADWDVTFSARGEHTVVQTIVSYQSAKDLQTVIDMGMEEGMASTLERLDELLAALRNAV